MESTRYKLNAEQWIEFSFAQKRWFIHTSRLPEPGNCCGGPYETFEEALESHMSWLLGHDEVLQLRDRLDKQPVYKKSSRGETYDQLKTRLALEQEENKGLKKRIAMLEAERGPGIKHEPDLPLPCDIDWD